MPDLDAAIRERIELVEDLDARGIEFRFKYDIETIHDALLAVLDLHADRPEGHMCIETIDGHFVQTWYGTGKVCPTKQAIAEKLGVSLTG